MDHVVRVLPHLPRVTAAEAVAGAFDFLQFLLLRSQGKFEMAASMILVREERLRSPSACVGMLMAGHVARKLPFGSYDTVVEWLTDNLDIADADERKRFVADLFARIHRKPKTLLASPGDQRRYDAAYAATVNAAANIA